MYETKIAVHDFMPNILVHAALPMHDSVQIKMYMIMYYHNYIFLEHKFLLLVYIFIIKSQINNTKTKLVHDFI